MTDSDKLKLVKNLVAKTGYGMMDCKNALVNCAWNNDKAEIWLENKGKASSLNMFQTPYYRGVRR